MNSISDLCYLDNLLRVKRTFEEFIDWYKNKIYVGKYYESIFDILKECRNKIDEVILNEFNELKNEKEADGKK